MSNPDVTDPPKTPTASTPTSGSVTPQRVGDDWMEYLDSTGNISRYDGMCDCYVCRQIKADYFPWKARKEEAKSLNAEVSGGASGRAARECGTDRANAHWLQRLVRHRATEAIAHAKKIAEKSQDWNLAWYVLRDLDAVKLAGLSDLAWAGHRDGNIHKNDLDGFIKDIEAWIAMPNEKS